jgi:hypothetical protein
MAKESIPRCVSPEEYAVAPPQKFKSRRQSLPQPVAGFELAKHLGQLDLNRVCAGPPPLRLPYHSLRTVRVVTIIDLLPTTIIDGSGHLHTVGVRVTSSLCSGLSFRSLLCLGGGTGNAPYISLRPPLITEHHFVSSLNDLARHVTRRSSEVGLGIANGQKPTLGYESWFRSVLSAQQDAGAEMSWADSIPPRRPTLRSM